MIDNLEFPTEDLRNPKKFDKTHVFIQATPYNEKRFAYSFLLPKGWHAVELPKTAKFKAGGQTVLGSFIDSDEENPAAVTVMFTPMPFEISIRDWVNHIGEGYGATFVCLKEGFLRKPFCDAGGSFVFTHDNSSTDYVLRLVSFIDGPGIYTIVASVPRVRYAELMRDFAIATYSFALQNPFGYSPLEKFESLIAKSPDFSISCPSGWDHRILTSKVAGKSGIDLILGKEGTLFAYLRAETINSGISGPKTDENLLKTATDELEIANIKVASAWTKDTHPTLSSIPGFHAAYVADGVLDEIPLEIRFGIKKQGKILHAIMWFCHPKASGDALLWMHAKRVYEIAFGTIKLE